MDKTLARERIAAAVDQARRDLDSGRSPTQTAEALYDATVTASGDVDDAPLVASLVRMMLACGYAQLQAARDDTRKLDAILRSARALLRREFTTSDLQQALDDAYQDWHWHGH